MAPGCCRHDRSHWCRYLVLRPPWPTRNQRRNRRRLYVADDDLVHVVRSGNSRKAKLRRLLPAMPASSSGPASTEFAEDTVNGRNKMTLQAAAALSGDVG